MNEEGFEEEEDQVIEELDVVLKPSKQDVYFVEYPLRQQNAGLSKFERIEYVQYKPHQVKFDYKVVIDSKCQNFERHSGDNSYTLSSKLINNRTHYCFGKIVDKQLLLTPVTNCVQLRRCFKDTEDKFKAPGHKSTNPPKGDKMDEENLTEESARALKLKEIQDINQQIERGENLKQIEKRLRTFRFQNELHEVEESIKLQYNPMNSDSSKRSLNALIDPPKQYVQRKAVSRSEYLHYLF